MTPGRARAYAPGMHRGARVAHSLALAPIAALAAALVAAPGGASAGPNDLVLARLGTRVLDGSGNVTSVVGDSLELRALASQLGVVLAPSLLTPADTLGLSGIQLSLIGGQTSISASEDYWRARAGSPDPAGAGGVAHGPSGLRTIGAALHKGLWFPLPSFELGVGAVHLLDSSIWAVQASAKLALVEGYHDLPLPSLAVRGAVSRMMNQRELDLTVASFEALVADIAARFLTSFEASRERCWIADLDGMPVGSVFLVRHSDEVAKLRLLLVDPAGRGHGLGKKLVDECVAFAKACGYRRITLWTQSILLAARGIYESAGFIHVATEPHRSFGHDLIGETWELTL